MKNTMADSFCGFETRDLHESVTRLRQAFAVIGRLFGTDQRRPAPIFEQPDILLSRVDVWVRQNRGPDTPPNSATGIPTETLARCLTFHLGVIALYLPDKGQQKVARSLLGRLRTPADPRLLGLVSEQLDHPWDTRKTAAAELLNVWPQELPLQDGNSLAQKLVLISLNAPSPVAEATDIALQSLLLRGVDVLKVVHSLPPDACTESRRHSLVKSLQQTEGMRRPSPAGKHTHSKLPSL